MAVALAFAWMGPPGHGTAWARSAEADHLLAEGDAALEAGERLRAIQFYNRVMREYPGTEEARAARRALRLNDLIGARPAPAVEEAPPETVPTREAGETVVGPEATPEGIVIFRKEPYSLQTSERVQLSTWEKIDFSVTAFTYGTSIGISWAIASDPDDASFGSVTFVTALYTLGSIAYLNSGDPDRGDLPLVLGITSYLPTTTLLALNLPEDHPSSTETSMAVALSGTAAVPIALGAARRFNFDPGDAQLVRDAGFWGLILGITGLSSLVEDPSGSQVAATGLAGLYGGLGLGLLAAREMEPSLERVRITTWAGYGGGLLGLMAAATNQGNDDRDPWTGFTIGALAGMTLAYGLSERVDVIPPETWFVGRSSRWRAAVSPLASATGETGWGLSVRWSH